MKLKLILVLAVLVLAPSVTFAASSTVVTLGPNLITNPQLETVGGKSMPSGWNEGSWGTNTVVFQYPVAGATGNGASVAFTSYTSGDAKWYFNNVAVISSTAYYFSDAYSSTVPSELVAQYTSKTNGLSYVMLGKTLPATGGVWTTASTTFTIPKNITAMTVFHLIQSVGSLTTDNYFLGTVSTSTTTSTPPAPALTIAPQTLPNGIVGAPFNMTLSASTTASGPFAWSIASGSLPPGLQIGISTGLTDTISGTPTTPGNFNFTVKATNGSSSGTASYGVVISPAVIVPVATSTLTVNIAMNGGTSTPANFNLTVKSNTSTLFNGSGAASQSFVLNVGNSYSVTEATTTNSAHYNIALGATCSGTITTSSKICALTNTFIPIVTTSTPTSTPNLILNPTFATPSAANPNIPASWQTSAWGDASGAVFAYPVAGEDDGFAGQVSIPSYQDAGEGFGAAEWYFNNVTVTPGALYNFSDWYKSNTDSDLIAQWTLTNGSLAYDMLGTFPTTNNNWTKTPIEVFSAPINAASVTILHLIQSAGTLTVDNYSLSLYSTTGNNLFPGTMASLTFDDGWSSQYDNALPVMNAAHVNGTFYIITDDLVNPANIDNLFSDSQVSTSTVTTNSSASWGDLYTDPTNQVYVFGETYTQTAPSTITANYTIAGKASSTVIGTIPAGSGATSFAFTLPMIAGGNTVTPITITQSLSGSGTLKVSNPSLIEHQLYMTPGQVAAIQAAGNEIDSHTETHPDLTSLSTPAATTEINGSRTALVGMDASPVDGFAYPFGDYNASVKQLVSNAGYNNARTVDVGYNDTTYDPLLIKSYSVVASTTLTQVESWINTAAANKWWLVLTFHDIDPANIIASNNETYGTTPQELQQIIAYLQSNNIPIRTMNQAITVK